MPGLTNICVLCMQKYYLTCIMAMVNYIIYRYSVMAKKSVLQMFEHYYQGLMHSLPLKDNDFMEDLSNHDLLPQNIKLKLDEMSKHKEKASYFLDSVIKSGLLVGDNASFITLLTVMSNSQYDSVKDLAKLIESEYDIDAESKSVI